MESIDESLISNVHAGGKALRLASSDAEQTSPLKKYSYIHGVNKQRTGEKDRNASPTPKQEQGRGNKEEKPVRHL